MKNILRFLILMSATGWAFAQPSKLSKDLQAKGPGARVDVIVQFTSTLTNRHIAKVTGKGAALKHKLSVIKGAAFTGLPASRLEEIAQDPEVAIP